MSSVVADGVVGERIIFTVKVWGGPTGPTSTMKPVYDCASSGVALWGRKSMSPSLHGIVESE